MKEQAAGRPSFAAAKANVKAEANFITGIELMRGIYIIRLTMKMKTADYITARHIHVQI